jgi:hypothetical protein
VESLAKAGEKLTIVQEAVLDMDRVSKLPLSNADVWREVVTKEKLRIEDFYLAGKIDVGDHEPTPDGPRFGRIRSADFLAD